MASSIRSVTYHCSVSSSTEERILRCVALASGIAADQMTFTSGGSSTLVRTVENAFTNTTESTTGIGWMGMLRLLAAPELMATAHSAEYAVLESWVYMMQQSIGPILQQTPSTSSLDETSGKPLDIVLELCQQIEQYLLEHHQTVLVGSSVISCADIVVTLGIVSAIQVTTTALAVPQQVFRYLSTMVHHLDRHMPLSVWSGDALLQAFETFVTEGEASPISLSVDTQVESELAVAATSTEQVPTVDVATKSIPEEKTLTAEPLMGDTLAVPLVSSSPSSSDNSTERILQLLKDFSIEYSVYDHPPCMTADELVQNVPLPEGVNETHTKNLIFRDKKHGIFLVTVATKSTVNTKDLGTLLKLSGKTNLRLADASVLQNIFHVEPGTVGPLCVGLMDSSASPDEPITIVWDQSLLTYAAIHSHPARNDQSVRLTPSALQDYAKKLNVAPVFVEFGSASTSTGAVPATKNADAKPTNAAPKKSSAVVNVDKKTAKKGETLLALQWKKGENFAMWYTDVIVLSEMISYYDISGCYILRPWSYKMWELIQDWFNVEIQKMGVENAYFPLFVSQDRLEREKDHVEGFAPEVAWVTKSGDGDLARPIAIRPTSETIMYPAYSDWIKSHRDLPLKLNQWSNVVRWEFKYPTPFLRTREFLWQEGHTAHSSFEDADETVMAALDLYRQVYEDLLAVPVIPGYKTEKEKFAGGFRTTTVEAYIAGSGRAIQGATSHNLGQNFGKMFDITFQDVKGVSQVAWQTSWGLTTRTIGVMVMVHGDDTGLVLPPRIAPIQVVIVPIISKNLTQASADPYCQEILASLTNAGVRSKYDDRDSYNPGWKYNHWEQKGVPVRIEVGPRDIEQKSARIVIRHSGQKDDVPIASIGDFISKLLSEIQTAMFLKAKEARDSHVVQVTDWKDFVPNLEKNNLVLTPWCGGEHTEWEDWVKTTSRTESLKSRGLDEEDDKTSTSVAAKTLCIPFTQPELPPGSKCIASGLDATCWVLWGRSY